MSEIIERWKPIVGYENHYEISDLGRVRSIDRFVPFYGSFKFCKSKLKKATAHYKNGYLSVMLKVEQVEKRFLLHRLVAEHFIPNPENKKEVNHKKGNKKDCRASELEWTTPKENTNHSIENGFTKHRHAIIAIQDCSLIEFVSKKECSKYFRASEKTIRNAIINNTLIKGHSLYAL